MSNIDRFFEELKQLPDLTADDTVAGIYCWYVSNATPTKYFRPVYIGQSKNMWKRWLRHRQKLKLLSSQCTLPKFPEYIQQKREMAYYRILETLSDKKIVPPYEFTAKKLEILPNASKEILMSHERALIHYYNTDRRGFNRPLSEEWMYRLENTSNTTKYEWETLVELLQLENYETRQLYRRYTFVLNTCPFIEIIDTLLPFYVNLLMQEKFASEWKFRDYERDGRSPFVLAQEGALEYLNLINESRHERGLLTFAIPSFLSETIEEAKLLA